MYFPASHRMPKNNIVDFYYNWTIDFTSHVIIYHIYNYRMATITSFIR